MEEHIVENASLLWTENMAASNFVQSAASNSSYNQDMVFVWYYVNGIGGVLISVLGVAGNVTAALVLMMPVMRNSTSILLVAMAIFDSVFLVLHCLVQSLTLIFFYNDVGGGYLVVREFLFKYCNALVHISHTGTIYMAVLVTVERAMAVLLPLKAKHICTRGRAWLASLAVAVWSVLYNVPKYLEFETDDQLPVTLFSVRKSNFGNSYFFNHIYVVYFNGAVHFIIPVGLIAVLNFKMVHTVCSRGKRMARQSSVRSNMQSKLTIMIVILTAIFCSCQLLAAVPLVLFPDENIGRTEGEDTECRLTCTVVRSVGETGTLLNSATNFIVYSIFGHKFRRCLRQMCCYCCRMVQRERFFKSSGRGSPLRFSSSMTRLQHMDGSFRVPIRNSRRKVGSVHHYRATENGSDETRLSNTSDHSSNV
ncbi:FMRFamide receptor-like [Biomphalaria glabrata]|uniref:FMRFamide receptor-like n=1 Tax=Biomphalaria glabrata TaxID=6526 RepID=A0A9W3AWI8_BIOGL|nr:FMRFamide receptor-like [Biomphalaria glabrata]